MCANKRDLDTVYQILSMVVCVSSEPIRKSRHAYATKNAKEMMKVWFYIDVTLHRKRDAFEL